MKTAIPDVKSGHNGKWNVFDIGAEPRQPGDDEENTASNRLAAASPSYPIFWTTPATTTTNAPVGPAIWNGVPPRVRNDDAGDDRSEKPATRDNAARDGQRQRQGKRHHRNGHPGEQVGLGFD